ncbi:DUF1242-domain-containing protein [Coprinopsis marcescibilis]|uniref:Protein kish n=1 Tax=Coprinopsis marcescibilis TaxID=230819 RepID=A0A5C3KUZ7_COPMA|nr:DUF1242-domain-containing protein [Coprinopsis marcescibilis]
MSALFNFQSLLLVILLFICTCTYVRSQAPSLVDRNKHGFQGLLFKCARIGEYRCRSNPYSSPNFTAGERLSPYVALACVAMAGKLLLE